MTASSPSAQADAVRARYGIDDAYHGQSFGYRALIMLGYLFIGLALITPDRC